MWRQSYPPTLGKVCLTVGRRREICWQWAAPPTPRLCVSIADVYGHGLAADVVSVKGATRAERWISTESLWKWIDARGKEFGIGDRISIEIRRIWHRSTAKSMPLTTAGRKINTRKRT
jgi:hypothetical protein